MVGDVGILEYSYVKESARRWHRTVHHDGMFPQYNK